MTKEEVLQVITDNITDNNSGSITAAVMRYTLNTMVEYTPEGGSVNIVQGTGSSTTAVMSQKAVTNAIGSVIPKFAGITNESSVTDGSPSDETNGEVLFNTATNTFIISVRGQGNFTNWSKITDYMTGYGGTPLTNKIFEYLSGDTSDTDNKKQYIFDGTGLVLLSSGESKQNKVEIIDLLSNQESYTIEPDKRYVIQQIGKNVTTTNITLSAFEDDGYAKSYEIDFTTKENVGEIIIVHENISIEWVKDLEILPNTRYLISIDATTPDDILTAMYVTIA